MTRQRGLFDGYFFGSVREDNVLYVSKNGDDSNNGTSGDPFLTIGHANDVAISMLNPVVDYDESVIIKVSPGIYTEHLTAGHQRVYIDGGFYDFENWAHGTIIYNTGADAAHHPFAIEKGLNLIGIRVVVDSGGVYGELPNKTLCSVCMFEGGHFISNDVDQTSYFNRCTFDGDAFKFEGTSTHSSYIAFRDCDIFNGTETIFGTTGTGLKEVKFERTKVGHPLKINGDWSTLIEWGEVYDTGKLTFDTNGFVSLFSTIIRNGIHFYSDTPLAKKCINCLFDSTPTGEGDITADESIEFIEYSGNHQYNGIDGEIITVSKIKNVGGGQNKYRDIHEALKGSLLTDTIINLEGDIVIDTPLIVSAGIDIQINGNRKWKITSTHATTLAELGLNQHLSFVNMRQIVGGKKIILNGNNSVLCMALCGGHCAPNYVNVDVTAGDASSFVYIARSNVIGTGAPAITSNDIDVAVLAEGSFISGGTNYPAILFTVAAHDKTKIKNCTVIHGGGTATVPIDNTSGTKINDVSVYRTAMNANIPTAKFNNSISNASNVVDAGITF